MSYTTATFARLDGNSDGHQQIAIVLAFTGNASEPVVEVAYPVDVTNMPTADYMRGLAMARIALLNNRANFITGATPNIGTVLDTTTPLPPPAASTFALFLAASAPFAPGATPQDVFSITGSATRKVTVVRMGLTTIQTTAGLNAWALVKRLTANSGGTSATVPGIPSDRAYPAATAVVRQYTANPTAGTLVGSLWSGRVPAPVLASAAQQPEVTPIVPPSLPIVLSGTGDVLAWNFGGVALPSGLQVQACVTWIEQ